VPPLLVQKFHPHGGQPSPLPPPPSLGALAVAAAA
jgi:hypothetical protein